MAKKNSTKTQTKEAWSASEPRVINFGQWNGINIKEAPLGWQPLTYQRGESDLPDNFLMLQNNVVTTSVKALETRLDTMPVCEVPSDLLHFTGVTHLHEDKLFAVCEQAEGEGDWDNLIYLYELRGQEDGSGGAEYDNHWLEVPVNDLDRTDNRRLDITDVATYAEKLIVLTRYHDEVLADGQGKGEIFVGDLDTITADGVSCGLYISDEPEDFEDLYLTPCGSLHKVDDPDSAACRLRICYVLTNQFGSTRCSPQYVIYLDHTPVEMHGGCYLQVFGHWPGLKRAEELGITGVDFYASIDENQDFIFIGHMDVYAPEEDRFYWNWMGAMNDTSQWTSVSLTVPTENTTKGVDANYVKVIDGRLYFWGGSVPNRLYIGGDPGNELSVARGVGGAFVDLDPGTGLFISSVHKFKTYNGASIVTIMCGNKNTNQVKRFNLLETNLTVTNELQSKGYEAEEVPNVIGCNSHYGSGVWADGLYVLNRYRLGVSTMQMEESNTLKVTYLSDAIQPIFTDRISSLLKNCRMMFADEIIFFALSVPDSDNDDDGHEAAHYGLDRIIFCYDINQKAWYTLSYERSTDEEILHLFNFDYEAWWEGIGVVTPTKIDRIPLTGPHRETAPEFTALIETGELGLRVPPQIYVWLAQLEFRFDYLVGDLDFEVFGIDYYGREYRVYHHVSTNSELVYEYPVWIRIDKNVQTYRVRIRGKAHFRMTHFMSKTYQQSDKMAIPYGYDARVYYMGRHGKRVYDHHYLDSYNNIREAIVT